MKQHKPTIKEYQEQIAILQDNYRKVNDERCEAVGALRALNEEYDKIIERERTTLLKILSAQFPTPARRKGPNGQDEVESMQYPEFTDTPNRYTRY